MIGCGTRNHAACKFFERLPDGKKTEFKIIDFWQNDFNKKADDKPPADLPILVSLFNTRLKLAEVAVDQPQGEILPQAVADLRAQIGRIPQESFPVKKVMHEVESAWNDDFWNLMTPAKAEFLRLKVAPLLRFAAEVDVSAETFTHKCERLKLQMLLSQPRPDLLTSIAEDVSLLPADVLYEPPLTQFGRNAVERFFTPQEIGELLQLLDTLAA